VTATGYTPVVTQAESAGLPNAPFSIEHAFTAQSGVTLTTSVVTRDLWHRFFEHQMQIDGGKNDGYAAWADSGGLTMGITTTAVPPCSRSPASTCWRITFFRGRSAALS